MEQWRDYADGLAVKVWAAESLMMELNLQDAQFTEAITIPILAYIIIGSSSDRRLSKPRES